jgi:hypothetical protein
MNETKTQDVTVEEIRKLALPLSTHIVSGEGLLDRAVTWTSVIHPEDDIASKSLQIHELILIHPSPILIKPIAILRLFIGRRKSKHPRLSSVVLSAQPP